MGKSRRVNWLFVVVAILVLTCLFTLATMGSPGAPAFSILHNRQSISSLTWALLAPGIIWVARRFPFGRVSPMRWLAQHIAFGALFAIAGIAIGRMIHNIMASAMSKDTSMSTEVTPPVVASIATGLLLYALISVAYQTVVYQREAREREAVAERLRADLAEAKLANIEGKLQPHFLFNALNSIAALVRVDARQAETMLEQLSELLRASMRANPMQEVSLEEALHLTEQYLAIERTRFQERLKTTTNVSDEAKRARVPQLLLQPLVENAVRHGLGSLESGGTVMISASVENGRLTITVDDDGIGIGNAPPSQTSNGLGLSSVRSVLMHLFGSDAQLDVSPRNPRGTRTKIVMPYRTVAA